MKTAFPWAATLFAVLAAIALALPAVVELCSGPIRVRILDARFHVLSAEILRSGNDPFYLGNQAEGRLRDFLRQKCHLNVKPSANLAPLALGPSSSLFGREVLPRSVMALCFSFSANRGAPPRLDGELLDANGFVSPVEIIGRGGHSPYWEMWNLDSSRTNAGSYTLRIKQAGSCLAEVEIKHLPGVSRKPYSIGSNAF